MPSPCVRLPASLCCLTPGSDDPESYLGKRVEVYWSRYRKYYPGQADGRGLRMEKGGGQRRWLTAVTTIGGCDVVCRDGDGL